MSTDATESPQAVQQESSQAPPLPPTATQSAGTDKPRKRQRNVTIPAELVTIEQPQLPAPIDTPVGLLRIAVEQNFDIDKLEKLMQLQREWEAGEARKAFFAALSKFQSEIPPIQKCDKIDAGRAGKRKFATLGTINEAIRPWLYANGLSFRFAQTQTPHGITVTCIVSHCEGHSEATTLTAGADISGGKNPIQSIGSTITYLERYTLVGALGLTTVDEDDDGGAGGSGQADPEQAQELTPEQRRQAAMDIARQAAGLGPAGPVATADPGICRVLAETPTQTQAVTPPAGITQQQLAEMVGLMKRLFPSGAVASEWLVNEFGVADPSTLTQPAALDVLIRLNRMAGEQSIAKPPAQGPESGNARLAPVVSSDDVPFDVPPLNVPAQQPQMQSQSSQSLAAVTAEQRDKIQQLTMRAYKTEALMRQNDWLTTLGLLRPDQLTYQQAQDRIDYLEQVTGDAPF